HRIAAGPGSFTATSPNEPSLTEHWRSLKDGVRTMVHHPQGYGLGNVGQTASRTGTALKAGESNYTELGVELGLLGAILWTAWGLGLLARLARAGLADRWVACVAAAFAGLREGGVRRTEDSGRTWADCALPEPGVFSLAVSGAGGAVYAGTEPSRLFRSDDRGASWRELEALLDLPSRPTWSFPPRPWTSHVRWIAPSPHDAALILVGIELGGLMRSTDGGESWEDHRPGAQRDVHSLAWHARDPRRAYEAGRSEEHTS